MSKARDGNLYVTTARTTLASLASKAMMQQLGFPIVDTLIMTQSRWDSTTDGIHYAAMGAYSDDWLGSVSAMFSQVILNTIFPSCTGIAN
ncbi:MAG: hypothetical protein P4L87_21405 [Formivibrio sp.]|nr:hypothetical protein [Formivibrio sp.]